MKIIEGGVCSAKGFKAGALHCGIRKSQTKKDLAMIRSDCLCNAAAVYTKNPGKRPAPVLLTKEHLADGKAQAVIINSGKPPMHARLLEWNMREGRGWRPPAPWKWRKKT